MSIDQAKLSVSEGFWQCANDFEPHLPVQLHRSTIGAYDIVELHCHETIRSGLDKTVLDKCPADALALSVWTHNVGGAGNVRAKIWEVRANFANTKDLGVVTSHV